MVEFSSFSMANFVFGCRLLMCWKNCSRLHLRGMENTSSTWRSHILGEVSDVCLSVLNFLDFLLCGALLSV